MVETKDNVSKVVSSLPSLVYSLFSSIYAGNACSDLMRFFLKQSGQENVKRPIIYIAEEGDKYFISLRDLLESINQIFPERRILRITEDIYVPAFREKEERREFINKLQLLNQDENFRELLKNFSLLFIPSDKTYSTSGYKTFPYLPMEIIIKELPYEIMVPQENYKELEDFDAVALGLGKTKYTMAFKYEPKSWNILEFEFFVETIGDYFSLVDLNDIEVNIITPDGKEIEASPLFLLPLTQSYWPQKVNLKRALMICYEYFFE
ncbi:MAG: hypothetical protein QW197_02410 [Candidatus Aenigmatarchaeota archaeon]